MTEPRRTQRAGLTVDQRMGFAEDDLDRIEAGMDRLAKALNRQTFALVGAVISFTTAAIILAYQIALAKP